VAANSAFTSLAQTLSISIEQLGLRVGVLCGALFPLLAILIFGLHLHAHNKDNRASLLSKKM
jgi:hypothetical protein